MTHPTFLAQNEATEVFFGVTKLFQSKDQNLRRMVYLIIKEICPAADEVRCVRAVRQAPLITRENPLPPRRAAHAAAARDR